MYDKKCLDKSWVWLQDSEIKELTMTQDFTLQDQIEFFEKLTFRSDYKVWSVILNDKEIIGAAGLKNHRGNLAEYWGYIGEKKYWNKGLGRSLVNAVEQKARDLNFKELDLKVAVTNTRAIALYEKVGYLIDLKSSEESYLRMVKRYI